MAHLMVAGGQRRFPHNSKEEIGHPLEVLARPEEGDVSAREVAEYGLPAGSAVRLRMLARAASG